MDGYAHLPSPSHRRRGVAAQLRRRNNSGAPGITPRSDNQRSIRLPLLAKLAEKTVARHATTDKAT